VTNSDGAAAAHGDLLLELSFLVNERKSVDEVFASFARRLLDVANFDYTTLLIGEPGSGYLEVVASYPFELPGARAGQVVATNSFKFDQLLASPEGYEYAPRPESATPASQEMSGAGMCRAWVSALAAQEQVFGVFTAARKSPAPFSDDERTFMLAACRLLTAAVRQEMELRRARRAAARAEAANELALALSAGESIEQSFQRLTSLMHTSIAADYVGLFLDGGEGFKLVDEEPRGVHQGIPPTEEGTRYILERLAATNFTQARTQKGASPSDALVAAGYRRLGVAVLRESDRPAGLVILGRKHSLPFNEDEQAFIELLRSLLSQSLTNSRRLARSEAEAARSRTLNEVALLLNRGETVEAIFSRLLGLLANAIELDYVGLLETAGHRNTFRMIGSRPELMRPAGTIVEFEDTAARAMLDVPEPVVQYQIEQSVELLDYNRRMYEEGMRRGVSVVIRHAGEVVGLLALARKRPERYGPEEVAFIETLTAMLGQAIANHRKLRESQAEAIRSQVLSELSMLLQEGDAITARFDHISELLLQAVGFDHISVTVRQPGTEKNLVVRSHALMLNGVPLEVDPEGIALLTEGDRLSQQYRTARSHRKVPKALHEAGFKRAASTVILSNDGVEGVVTVGRRDDVRFDDREMGFIELVAALIGQATANQRKAWARAQEAEEQTIVAEAASAVAREITALSITSALRQAVGRFIPQPFCNFGYLEGESVNFSAPGRDRILLPIGPGFRNALDNGYDLVPRTILGDGTQQARAEVERTGLQSHVIASAQSGGETVGLLIVGSRDPDFEPGEREVRLTRLIADIVGPAMANVRAIERQRQEGEDQRLLAEVAAVAARASEPAALLAALHRPLRAIVPSPTVIFGYRDGDNTVLPRLDGTYTVVPLNPYLRMLDDMVQIHSDELPEDLFAESELWQMGIHAISSTAVLAAGKAVGYLMVGSRAKQYAFGERELRLFRLIAQIVGPAMENARAAEKAREDAEEQGILAEAAAALAAGATELAIIAGLAPAMKRFLPGSVSTVFFMDGEALISPEGFEVRGISSTAAAAMAEGQVVVERPWPELSEAGREMLDQAGFARFVSTSLNAGGVSTGILFVGVREEAATFRERDLRLIRLIADMAGPALANARESSLRRQDAEEQRFLAETAAAAASAASEAELVRSMAKPFEGLIPGSKIDLFFHQDDEMLSAITGLRFPVGAGFRQAIETGQSMGTAVAPGTSAPSLKRQKELGITYGASTRLSSGGQTLGLFWLGSTRDEPLSERDLRICRLVADVVGPALANLRESRRRKEDAEDQRFLAEVATSVARATTQEALVRGLWEPFRSITPSSRVAFFFREGDTLRGPGGDYGIGPQIEEAFREGMSLGSIDDPEVIPKSRAYMREQGLTTWANLLAESEGETLGILHVALRTEGAAFSPRELRLYRLAAAIVGPAMAHLRQNARRAREAEDERVLARVAAMAAVTNSPDELIHRFTEILEDFIPTPLAFYGHAMGDQIRYRISLPNAREQLGGLEELMVAMSGASREAREQGQGTGNLANRSDQPYSALNMQAYAVTAYHSVGSEMGLLLVATRDPGFEFSIEDLSLLRRIAQVLGPAIEAARAETERARQADLYSLMLRSLSEGVILADNTGRPVFSNDLGRRLLRALNPSGEEIEWQDITHLLPEEAREPYRRVFELGEAGRGRTALLMDGELTHLDFELVPLDDPQMKLLVVVTDVTADVLHEEEQLRNRERMEQAARLAALGELIGGVAHELNNPLTAVVGFAELMAANPAAESLSEEISVIQKEARRAADIVRDLLFIARPGTSERSLISVNELIGHIERIRRAHWASAEIEPDIAIDDGCQVWGNEHQLTQVILNLVTNAEHALAGQPDRQLRLSAVCGGDRTTITVSDSGKGMDQSTLDRIWEPFFTTRPGVGTGLGLPLSYSIIQSHHGVITVESRPGMGTTIRLDLPATPDAPGPTTDEPIRDTTTARVLVVDDEPSLRKVCQRLVASLGHECDTAENSSAATELARTRDYDLVLCDYRLATETADRVIAGFAEVAPALIERTIIATGATTDAGVLELTEKHNLELMAKPYGVEELSRIIGEALARSQAAAKAKTPFPALPGPPVS
jgi:signal transduction histidine kinase/CheY-like chemotaxis protein